MKLSRSKALTLGIGVIIGLAISLTAVTVVYAASKSPVPTTNPDAIAEQFDLKVVWYEDDSPCGSGTEAAGCYWTPTPDVIYIERGMDADTQQYAVLHEIGHAIAHRLNLPADECKADRFAQSLGSDMGFYCPPER